MPSAINQLQNAQVITGRMVRQAMQEAQGDATQMEALDKVCNDRGDAFQDARVFDELFGFVQGYYKDRFEFRDNVSNPPAAMAQVTEARITKVVNREVTIDRTPPPNPPPPRRWRDPLNITGEAEAGSKVEFYNASQPGRPVIGDVQVDPTGHFRFELTDETKFEFGDQIGLRVIDDSGKASEPRVVPTEPFQVTNTKTTFTRYGRVEGTTETTHHQALGANHDLRDPFFQKDKVDARFTPPATPDGLSVLELVGGDDAVEPNSTLTVNVGNESYTTQADKYGKFQLKVLGFEPGDTLKVEVRDINGNGIDLPYLAPEVGLNISALADAVARPPSPRQPTDAREVVGNGPPWVHFKAADVTVPFGAVMMKNRLTGDVFELNADAQGRINAAVGGLNNFDVLEVVARDAAGKISESAEVFVMLPEKVKRSAPFMMPAGELTQKQPDVSKVIEQIKGPPQDVLVNGKKDPRGPFLKIPDISGMPPYGQLAVVREGRITQYLRADKDGKLQGLLRGVNVGDQLNFQLLDAAGRKFPMELSGWRVPGAGKTSEVPEKHTHLEDMTLAAAADLVGKGELAIHNEGWLDPFVINSGPVTDKQTNTVQLNYKRQFFGHATEKANEVDFDHFPPALAQKLYGRALANNAGSMQMDESTGTKRLLVQAPGGQQRGVGLDPVVGQVNLGDPNSPIQLPGHIPHLTEMLKDSLSFVALAYTHGKEPGDVGYDRAMSTAKSILYVMDRLAVDHPDHKDALKQAAADTVKGFEFELINRFHVPPSDARGPNSDLLPGPQTGALNVLSARAAQLGAVAGVGQVGSASGDLTPPTVDHAIVLVQPRQQGSYRNPMPTPLRVEGSASAGDIVQIYNMSSANKTLLAEAVAGPDGKYKIVAGGDIQPGDQLGLMTVTSDGKTSAVSVVPTDTYLTQSGDAAHLRDARPVLDDDRPPFFRPSATKLTNSTFANGESRAGGPFWTLTGDELSVEPFSTVQVSIKRPDGTDSVAEAKVDGQGRFELEFSGAPRTRFQVQIKDRNGRGHHVNMVTPGLAQSIQTGADAAGAAMGSVAFQMPNGDTVRGVVIASSFGDLPKDALSIQTHERKDDFVDVWFQQNYSFVNDRGQAANATHNFRAKIPADEAAKFNLQPGAEVAVMMPGFESVDQGDLELLQNGNAKIRDRDYVVAPQD